ncbi:RbsD/FucU domain-containing protein [Nonomuraea sp. NPDC049158]|uniref:RbsD/FucU domain-containing protein n=1 Tax=Nonomuraea sp. NPDC049158 TaxID=3155649 RepID=UPI0033DB234C
MRHDGLWHPRLLHILSAVGHTDLIVVADPGLPVPPGVETVDLVWRRGEPAFLPVLEAVLGELVVETAYVAEESPPGFLDGVLTRTERIPHTHLKQLTGRARAVVRTGEATPYANVVLQAGVPF